MSDSTNSSADTAPPRAADRPTFHELPLVLAARLAIGRARVRALRQLAPGSVLPMETPVGEASRLVAEGSVVAAGEIVEIQGHLALRLTRLGDAGE